MKTKLKPWLLLLVVGTTACYDFSNFENIAIEPISPAYVIPLINDSISLKEIMEQMDSIDLIRENPDNSYSLLFRDTVDAGFAVDQFSIPNQTFSQGLFLPFIPPVVIPAQTYDFDMEYNESIATNTEAGATVALKRVDFSSGTLQITLVNNFNHRVTGEIILTSVKNSQNVSLVLPFALNNYGSVYNNTINLRDYYFDSYHPALNQYNNLSYRLRGTLTTIATTVNPGDNVSIQLSIVNPTFSRITGKINYSFVQDDQSYNVDLFQSPSDVQQHFADPRVTLQFINSYGVPAFANFTKFEFVTSSDQIIPVTNTRTNPDDLKIGVPNTITHITQGQTTATTTLQLNKDNSNIVTAFNSTPKEVRLGATFDLGDNTANHDYFINQSSTIKLISEIEIPIHGWVKISLSDTLTSPELPKLSEHGISDVDISVTLKVGNQIPLNIYFQAKFLDNANQVLAQLFDNKPDELLIDSAPVSSAGISNGTKLKKTEITVDKAKYDLMSNATKMIIHYRLVTGGTDEQSIKILSTNKFFIQASLSVKGTIKPKL